MVSMRMGSVEDQIRQARAQRANAQQQSSNTTTPNNNTDNSDDKGGIQFGTNIAYDDAYASNKNNGEYVTSIPTMEEERRLMMDENVTNPYERRRIAEMEDAGRTSTSRGHPSTMARDENENEASSSDNYDPFQNSEGGSGLVNTRISDRESDYHKRRHNRSEREDGMSYSDAMKLANIDREKHELLQQVKKDLVDGDGKLLETKDGDGAGGGGGSGNGAASASGSSGAAGTSTRRRRRRWDDADSNEKTTTTTTNGNSNLAIVSDSESVTSSKTNKSRWDEDVKTTRRRKRWDETPVTNATSNVNATPLFNASAPDATPLVNAKQWDETPIVNSMDTSLATPMMNDNSSSTTTGRKRSRWDLTPAPNSTPSITATPSLSTSITSSKTPSTTTAMTGDLSKALSLEKEMETRNRPWTESALDSILPQEGYTILPPPPSYQPLRTPGRKLLATPTPLGMTPAGFHMDVPPEMLQGEGGTSVNDIREAYGIPIAATSNEVGAGALPFIKPEDYQYFGKLTEGGGDGENDASLSKEEINERKIMTLLLKIKNGTPPQRKTAMRQITDKARSFGAAELFHQILPLFKSPTLEDQERHLLVKVIDRVLYKLDDLVRPYVHRILAVIQPLLIDEDYYARIEGREIISNLAKAAGLATMIATMRPDIDNPDEYVRNITSRAFAVVASALGVPALIPFLKAVCQSRKSWQARHTGIKIVQQIAVLMGCAVLPYLRELVEIVSHGLTDDQMKVKTMTALTVAALAEAAYPYGVESFDPIIRPLWKGGLEHHGKMLAAFLKAIGYVIPLMEENYASHYTRTMMPILLREFHSPDEEMKKIVLKVIKQCVSTVGVEPEYIRKEILPEFFKNFWIRRMALDRRNYNQVVETTVELANKVGSSEIITRIVDDLKDDSEPYRRMVMETVQQVLENLGSGDIDDRLEERLIDGILYAFQEQAVDASLTGSNAFGKEGQVMLDGFGTVVNALGERCKPYLKQIAGTIKWRLNNKAPSVRMQAADLIGRIAVVMKACGEDQLMGHLGVVLYEYLGEEYPEVLGSILGALRAIVNVIGMTKMTPPISDLLPRLTPILRNRHEKVQENCIDLVRKQFHFTCDCNLIYIFVPYY